jgi:hypothetical protein
MAPGQAQDAGNGHSLVKSCNDIGGHFPRNPKGRACFCARRRYSMAHLDEQISHLAPCLAQQQAPARFAMKRQQALVACPVDR